MMWFHFDFTKKKIISKKYIYKFRLLLCFDDDGGLSATNYNSVLCAPDWDSEHMQT